MRKIGAGLLCAKFRARDIGSQLSRPISTNAVFSANKVPKLAEDLNVHDYGTPNIAKKRLYVFGLSSHGALGLSTLVRPARQALRKVTRPIRHEIGGALSVMHAAAGHGFSLLGVKTHGDDGFQLFGTGLNTHSQIGYHAPRANAPLEVLLEFVPIQLPVKNKAKVSAIGCGRAHTVVSLKGDGVFTLGDNSFGQCGRRVIPDEAYFGSKYIHKIKELDPISDEVVKIVSRFDVTYCLTKDGRVFSFGSNLKGQLGRGRQVPKEWEPVCVEGGDLSGGEKVVALSTSGRSTMALTDKGEVFAWGCNEAGNVNPGALGHVMYEPRHLNLGSKIGKVLDVAVGELCSFIVNGTSKYGRLKFKSSNAAEWLRRLWLSCGLVLLGIGLNSFTGSCKQFSKGLFKILKEVSLVNVAKCEEAYSNENDPHQPGCRKATKTHCRHCQINACPVHGYSSLARPAPAPDARSAGSGAGGHDYNSQRIKWESEELTNKHLVKQACTLTVDSVIRLVSVTVSALEDKHMQYREFIAVFMDLLEESRTATEGRQELISCKMVVIRNKLEELKSCMAELEAYLCIVDRLAQAACEAAFTGGAESASIFLSQALQTAALQTKLLREVTMEAERNMLELQSVIIVESGKSLT